MQTLLVDVSMASGESQPDVVAGVMPAPDNWTGQRAAARYFSSPPSMTTALAANYATVIGLLGWKATSVALSAIPTSWTTFPDALGAVSVSDPAVAARK